MKKKQLLSLMLVASMALGVTACGSKKNNNSEDTQAPAKGLYEGLEGDALSDAVYDNALSEFAAAYEKANEAKTNSERYALQAIAEAKFLEAAVYLPTSSNGGRYAMSRVVPYTVDYSLWGTDEYRYHQALVATEFLKTEDRDAVKKLWGELRGTGTYLAKAKEYLTGKGYSFKDEYKLGYSSDPQTWDILATYRAADSEAIVNTYDGLLEYNEEGTQVPALATALPEVSEDGLTYTFTVREGVAWVNSQGQKIADLTADDFVKGMQHLLDAEGGLEGLLFGIVKNAQEYVTGDVTDFAEVGVKAEGNKVIYTLAAPCPYFLTMFGYNMFAPICPTYFEAKGGAFGKEEFAAASASDSYTYGTTPENIAYCGPYLVSGATASNSIYFTANESYWNKANINIKKITWLYNDGSDELKAYKDAVAATIDGCGLTAAPLEQAKADGLFDKYAYVSSTDATSFGVFFNQLRRAYANFNDDTALVSTQTEDQKKVTNYAMSNVHFRRALAFAVDRSAYNACAVGDELKDKSVINTYTPGNFVVLEEAVTVSINGTDTKFEKGTYYGAIMQAQLDADGSTIKAWDPTADSGIGASSGFDGWYNPTEAAKELEKAVAELAKAGIEISADAPVVVDMPYYSASTVYTNRANAVKQSVEKALGGKVVVNIIGTEDLKAWYYAGYYAEEGGQDNYDLYDCSGWGPDFGDPCTYLDTMLKYDGSMVKMLGTY